MLQSPVYTDREKVMRESCERKQTLINKSRWQKSWGGKESISTIEKYLMLHEVPSQFLSSYEMKHFLRGETNLGLFIHARSGSCVLTTRRFWSKKGGLRSVCVCTLIIVDVITSADPT